MKKSFSINTITQDNKLNPFLLEKLTENNSYYLFYNTETNEYDAYKKNLVDDKAYNLDVLLFKYKHNYKCEHYLISNETSYYSLQNLTMQVFNKNFMN